MTQIHPDTIDVLTACADRWERPIVLLPDMHTHLSPANAQAMATAHYEAFATSEMAPQHGVFPSRALFRHTGVTIIPFSWPIPNALQRTYERAVGDNYCPVKQLNPENIPLTRRPFIHIEADHDIAYVPQTRLIYTTSPCPLYTEEGNHPQRLGTNLNDAAHDLMTQVLNHVDPLIGQDEPTVQTVPQTTVPSHMLNNDWIPAFFHTDRPELELMQTRLNELTSQLTSEESKAAQTRITCNRLEALLNQTRDEQNGNPTDQAVEFLQHLENHAQVVDYCIDPSSHTIHIQTSDIHLVHHADSGWTTLLGSFLLSLSPNQISLINLTNRKGRRDHPHIQDGTLCLGTHQEATRDLLTRRQYIDLLNMLLAYLGTYNPTDQWGQSHSLWFEQGDNPTLMPDPEDPYLTNALQIVERMDHDHSVPAT